MLRLFVTSSQICTVYLSVYAKKSVQQGYKDILIIDNTKKKKALVEGIQKASKIHNWTEVIDLSENIANELNSKPSLRKRITRKMKSLLFIRSVYGALHAWFVKKQDQKRIGLLRERLKNYLHQNSDNVELGMLTQTSLNKPLIQLFPGARKLYFEHGIGDYFYISTPPFANSSFYCVFAASFSKFVSKNNYPVNVHGYIEPVDYRNAFDQLSSVETDKNLKKYTGETKLVLILMDAAEIYHPPKVFWTDYLAECIRLTDTPENYRFLLKPHPAQSNEVLEITEQYFKTSGLDFVMLKDQYFIHSGVELLYHDIYKDVDYVFSTFSSALFYLAHFYPQHTKYYYLYNFVKPYFKNAPQQYSEIFSGLDNYFNEVFSGENVVRI
ncbi:MAG: hypothetical protein HYZ14_12915 [Bacteroidetes bacterium]|nr:hypothetical protein [Bacteroidota bacterium]